MAGTVDFECGYAFPHNAEIIIYFHSKRRITMPISVGKLLIQFACSKTHIGLYPGPEAVEAFADRLKGYKTNKGTIRLPLDQKIPIALIADIARWCWENSEVRSPE